MNSVDGNDIESIPVRSLQNFIYCPRLMFFQLVEKIYIENSDTVEGDRIHSRVDTPTPLEIPDEIFPPDRIVHRSLALESKIGLHGVIDIVEKDADKIRIVDYKRGTTRKSPSGEIIPKDSDIVQLQAYAFLMRENGITFHEAAIFYAKEKIKIPITVDNDSINRIPDIVEKIRTTISAGMPEPLHGDPRCLYCSLYPVCLPEETLFWKRQQPLSNIKKPPMSDNLGGEYIIIQEPHAYLSKKGETFIISKEGENFSKHPIERIRGIQLYGPIQFSTQVMHCCLENNIPISFFSPAGRFLGLLSPLTISGLDSRSGQYQYASSKNLSMKIIQPMIYAKISNQRTLLIRNAENITDSDLKEMLQLKEMTLKANTKEELTGIEGRAAAIYFENFTKMIKNKEFKISFKERNRRPPRDPINSMISLGYSVLASEIAGICTMIGLDPACGLLHSPRYGRPALALDLMEEFRPLIVDSVTISIVNRNEITPSDFIFSSKGCNLKPSGRKVFWEAYFRRMNTEITHPQFNYKMTYRRMLEIQARQIWRIFRGDASSYYPIITR
ncbi:MAG TPA: CRISPR-associated endonuclease Cas1 [Victivallales bacterium]|nr:CRISPR-associated endonuclease Cas1 [Victivallales bacterium]